MAPPRDLDLAQTLQGEWRRRMEKREDKIERQRDIKIGGCEIVSCPRAKKNERRQPGQRFNDDEPALN